MKRKFPGDRRCPVCGSDTYIDRTQARQSRPGIVGPGNKPVIIHDYFECAKCTTHFSDPAQFAAAPEKPRGKRSGGQAKGRFPPKGVDLLTATGHA